MSDSEADYIKRIKEAAKKRAAARKQLRLATDELRVYCAQAKYQGVPITRIALEAELSRQGVYDLLREEPPSA
jgi:hypothetical protein